MWRRDRVRRDTTGQLHRCRTEASRASSRAGRLPHRTRGAVRVRNAQARGPGGQLARYFRLPETFFLPSGRALRDKAVCSGADDGLMASKRGDAMRTVVGSKHWLTVIGSLLLVATCSSNKDKGAAVCGGTSGGQAGQGGASGTGGGPAPLAAARRGARAPAAARRGARAPAAARRGARAPAAPRQGRTAAVAAVRSAGPAGPAGAAAA